MDEIVVLDTRYLWDTDERGRKVCAGLTFTETLAFSMLCIMRLYSQTDPPRAQYTPDDAELWEELASRSEAAYWAQLERDALGEGVMN